MGLTKKIIIVLLFFITFKSLMVSCKKTNNESNINKDKIEITSLSKNTTSPKILANTSKKKYTRIKEMSKNGDKYIFDFFSISLSEREGEDVFFKQDLNVIKGTKKTSFKIDDDFDLGEFHLWVYELDKRFIFLLELDDYYDSIFYAYHLSDNCLVRLGDFSMPQPNVEKEGIKIESFKIYKKNDIIHIDTYLDKKSLSNLKMNFKDDCISVIEE